MTCWLCKARASRDNSNESPPAISASAPMATSPAPYGFSIKSTAPKKVLTCRVATRNGGTLPLATEKARLSVLFRARWSAVATSVLRSQHGAADPRFNSRGLLT